MIEVREKYPEAQVDVWAMDEHRVGLQRTTQRTWSKKGVRNIEPVFPGYKWSYVWAWVCPRTGELDVWLSKYVCKELHGEMLSHLAERFNIGPKRRMIIVLDGASWHTSKNLEIPDGIDLFFLPPRTPELQPAERLWKIFDEPLIGLASQDIEEVVSLLNKRTNFMIDDPKLISSHTLFHWWPC